jgi:uroporphyrinogen-III synthase
MTHITENHRHLNKKRHRKHLSKQKNIKSFLDSVEAKVKKSKTTVDYEEIVIMNKRLFELGFASFKDYLASDLWRKNRKIAYVGQCTCEACRRKGSLQVHHKTYKNLGAERKKDLSLMCDECHREVHSLVRRGFKIAKATQMVIRNKSKS